MDIIAAGVEFIMIPHLGAVMAGVVAISQVYFEWDEPFEDVGLQFRVLSPSQGIVKTGDYAVVGPQQRHPIARRLSVYLTERLENFPIYEEGIYSFELLYNNERVQVAELEFRLPPWGPVPEATNPARARS